MIRVQDHPPSPIVFYRENKHANVREILVELAIAELTLVIRE
jgi:hypothetical protein